MIEKEIDRERDRGKEKIQRKSIKEERNKGKTIMGSKQIKVQIKKKYFERVVDIERKR